MATSAAALVVALAAAALAAPSAGAGPGPTAGRLEGRARALAAVTSAPIRAERARPEVASPYAYVDPTGDCVRDNGVVASPACDITKLTVTNTASTLTLKVDLAAAPSWRWRGGVVLVVGDPSTLTARFQVVVMKEEGAMHAVVFDAVSGNRVCSTLPGGATLPAPTVANQGRRVTQRLPRSCVGSLASVVVNAAAVRVDGNGQGRDFAPNGPAQPLAPYWTPAVDVS